VYALRDIKAGEEITISYIPACCDGDDDDEEEEAEMNDYNVGASSSSIGNDMNRDDPIRNEQDGNDMEENELHPGDSRRAALKEFYGFDCKCPRCLSELEIQV